MTAGKKVRIIALKNLKETWVVLLF